MKQQSRITATTKDKKRDRGEFTKAREISNGKARKKTCQAIPKEKDGTSPQPGFCCIFCGKSTGRSGYAAHETRRDAVKERWYSVRESGKGELQGEKEERRMIDLMVLQN